MESSLNCRMVQPREPQEAALGSQLADVPVEWLSPAALRQPVLRESHLGSQAELFLIAETDYSSGFTYSVLHNKILESGKFIRTKI